MIGYSMKNRTVEINATEARPGRMTSKPIDTITSHTIMEALSTALSVSGEVRDVGGTATGILKIETNHGTLPCTVDEFGNAYRGMVRLWPAVAKIREQQDKRRVVQAAQAREAAKAAAIEQHRKEVADRAKAREVEKAKAAKLAKAKAKASKAAK